MDPSLRRDDEAGADRNRHHIPTRLIGLNPLSRVLFLRTVKQHPDAEIPRDVLEAMRHMRGAEQKVAGADIADLILDPVTARPRGDEIEFVARMRNLRAVR